MKKIPFYRTRDRMRDDMPLSPLEVYQRERRRADWSILLGIISLLVSLAVTVWLILQP